MKLRNKLIGTIGCVFAGGMIAASPLIASAQEVVDADVVAFSGTANASVPWVLGSGSYSFGTGAPLGCTGISADAVSETTADLEVAAPCTITSSGSFTNVVCGTGLASGNATVTEAGGSDTYNISYTIVFVAGVGVLVGTGTDAGDVLPTSPVAGVVQITPTALETANIPGGECTPGFTVSSVDVTTA